VQPSPLDAHFISHHFNPFSVEPLLRVVYYAVEANATDKESAVEAQNKMLNSSLLEDLETDLQVARLRERIAQKNVITSENDIERATAKRCLEQRGKEVAKIQRTIEQLKDERKWKWF
jgi:hypothetical protein